jgi:hypothetical protein
MSVVILTSILQLQDLVRGEVVEKVDKAVETAQQATQARALQPRHGPKANKGGRTRTTRMAGTGMANNGATRPRTRQDQKRKCKFCLSRSHGNIQSCKQLKGLGQTRWYFRLRDK